MNRMCLILGLILGGVVSMNSQLQFIHSNHLLHDRDLHSGVVVGVADMNGDGLDDIISLDQGEILYVQYQTPDPSRPFIRYAQSLFIDGNPQNDICIADFNNDGINDILTVGSYDRVKVLYGLPDTYGFDLTHIVVTPFFSQGASSGDFNHDGWVDVVMLNDNGLNYTLINDGTGTLVRQDLFDFVTVPPSDNSGNYGCLYTDFDMDGDLDFYIAKCRQGVNSQTDPRRINVLFVNDGTGNYTQAAAQYGLASGRQSWTAEFGDMDNDGDLDCFLTQHDIISELFENINNDTFINITSSSGLNIGGVPLQGMFRDFDNDGFQDLLVSGDRVDFYRNNGDKTFTKQDPFGNLIFGTYALGDLNQDGFTDVYASRVRPFNNPDLLREDILFLNQGNENHFISLALTDTAGNPSAIGAMAILYSSLGIQVREVRGGEQYGVSNGHKMIFGLGPHTTYDSLIIRWPDGTRELMDSLEVDRHWNIRRGKCVKKQIPVFPLLHVLCNNDSLILYRPSETEAWEWSTGSTEDSIDVKTPGLYYAVSFDTNGCRIQTLPIEVAADPDTIRPTIYYIGNTLLCSGEKASLSLPAGLSYQWSTGEITQEIEADETGDYFAWIQGYCKTQMSDTLHLDFYIPGLPVTTNDTILLGGTATLLASGDSILWFSDSTGIELIGSGAELVLEGLTDTTVVYAQNIHNISGLDYQVGPVNHQGTTKYNAAFVNGGLLFDVFEPVIIHQMTLHTDSAGTRVIEITNGSGFFFDYEAELDSGSNIVNLEAEIPAGSYTISTNTAINNQVFGANNPYLWRSSQGVLFPYEAPGVLSITNSTFGSDFYYYFYDWKISSAGKFCGSPLVPATAFVDLETGVNPEMNDRPITIVPNPASSFVRVAFPDFSSPRIQLSDMDGKVWIYTAGLRPDQKETTLDLSALPPGVFVLSLTHQGLRYVQKIIRL